MIKIANNTDGEREKMQRKAMQWAAGGEFESEHEKPGDAQLGGEFEAQKAGGFELSGKFEQCQEQESIDQSIEQDLGI